MGSLRPLTGLGVPCPHLPSLGSSHSSRALFGMREDGGGEGAREREGKREEERQKEKEGEEKKGGEKGREKMGEREGERWRGREIWGE